MTDEICLIHGRTKRYDMRSGFNICDECEPAEHVKQATPQDCDTYSHPRHPHQATADCTPAPCPVVDEEAEKGHGWRIPFTVLAVIKDRLESPSICEEEIEEVLLAAEFVRTEAARASDADLLKARCDARVTLLNVLLEDKTDVLRFNTAQKDMLGYLKKQAERAGAPAKEGKT